MQTKIKKMLAVILSLLMVMTMLPMTVIPSSAAEYVGHHNIKVEVVDWVVRDAGQIVGEFNAVEHGDAFYYESLTEADDGTFTFSYTLALERNGGNTAWDENSISFKIDSCEEEFLQEFEKSFVSSCYIEYNIKVSRRAGHSFSDWADVGDGTHTRICSFCGTVETKAHSFSGANCTTKGKCVCGLESTKDSNNHAKPVKHVVNSENEFKHDEVYECCGVVNSNLDHKFDSNGMCKECKYQCEHTAYTNGICDVCRYKCPHTAIVDGECTICGKVGILYINRYWDEKTKSVAQVTEIASVETIEVDGSFSTLQNECWYVVRGDISRSSLTVSGTAHLILADGATLNLSSGLRVNEGNTLYIYAQSSSDNCGKLVSVGADDCAGIGGGGYRTNCGTIVINGGNIEVVGGYRSAGIGGGGNAKGGNITINGGIVTATPGSNYSAAIGGSETGAGGNITINGGTVIANGRIGSYSGSSENITINGGNITSGGIGSRDGSSGNITINGGNVTSSSSIGGKKVNSIVVNGGVISVISTGEDNAAIGGGYQGNSGNISINGGTIAVTGGKSASAIGGGNSGYVDSITITGGTVIATGSNQTAASVGSYKDSKNCAVVLSGGNIKASQVRGVSVTDGNGNDVALNTITLSGASADTAVTKVEGIAYGLDDVKTLDTDKLYFYLPADSALSAITAGENEYICNRNLTYHTSHDWSDANGICTGCGDKCDHAEQTGEICGICGGLTHIHSFAYTANGNVITATCSNTDGKCPDTNGGTLTISAPAELYTDGTISREATVENNLVDTSVAVGEITYSTADGSAPKTAGTYTASVTASGATATVEFTLLNYLAKVTDKDGNGIEGSPFKTLEAAADAVRWDYENATITLLDDITLDSMWRVGGVVTIDLNGKKLNCTSGDTIFVQAFDGFAVTVVDSSENKTGVIRSETGSAIDVGVGSKFILNSGTITTENYYAIKAAYRERNHSLLEVNGGTVNGVVICYADSVVTGGTFNDMFAISYNYKQNKFSGGIFNGGIKITSSDPLNNILADGYHFRNAQGKVVDGSSEIIEEKVTIEKGADFSADAVVTVEDVVYNGSAQEPDVTVTIGGKILTEGKDYTIAFANNINAGTATVTVKAVGQAAGGIVGSGNSNVGNSVESVYTGEITKEFTILKADSAVETQPTANELTYNGTAQKLITAGSSESGTVVYSLDGAEYSETIPTGINAGEYTVYYKVEGDSNHNDSEPEMVTVTIGKKSVTAIATVADKVYDGTTTVDASAIEITFDGIVDGDDVKAESVNANFSNENTGNNKTVNISYKVVGEDVANYEIYEDGVSIPESEYYFIETKVNILPKDIADAQITLGDALVYNGAEQTQSIASVTVAGLEVTYTVSGNTEKNVGVYQLTVTGTGNFTGEAKITFEIAVDMNGIDFERLYWDNVKSTDKDRIEYVYDQINNVEWNEYADAEKRAEWNGIKGNCNELLIMIENVTSHLESFKNEVASYNIDTVTSDDYDYLEKLYESEAWWLDLRIDNYTEDEYKEFSDTLNALSQLTSRIWKVSLEIDRIEKAVNAYDEATVTSADKYALVQLNEDIYALALTDNVTAEEKENLQAAHDKVFALIDKLVGISDEIKRITEKVDAYVFESVKSSDKADIQQLIADIKALLDTQNLTADERALLETADETCDKLIAKIDETIAEVERIDNETNAYDIETVTAEDKENIENLLADIGVITDTDNLTADERTQLNGNAETLESLLETINDVAEEIVRIEDAVNSYDESTIKSSDTDDLNQLKADIKALTDGANLTDGERANLAELDATIAALLKKIADTQVEIERIDEAVNGYDIESVNSADIQALGNLIDDIETLTNGDNITEEEKAALEDNKATIDALVKKLTEVAEEIARVNEAVNGYDEETIKSSDREDLAQLKEDIQALIDSTNTTENEKTALGEMIEKVNALLDKISETEEKLEEIKGIENNFNPENVSSDDKAAIEEKIAEIEAVNPDNLTEEQKAEYDEIKAGFEALLEEIEKAGSEVDAIGAELEMFDEERVTIFSEDEIEALKAKIEELLADTNMGEAEKAKLNEYMSQAEKLIEIINTPAEYFAMRIFYFIWDALHWLSSHVVFIFNWILAMF